MVPLQAKSVWPFEANASCLFRGDRKIGHRNMETAKLACFLNSLRPSFTRVVRWKNTERTKRKIGIAAASKAMILNIIVRCRCRVTRAVSFDHLVADLRDLQSDVEPPRPRGV